jgi:hypothetical protein
VEVRDRATSLKSHNQNDISAKSLDKLSKICVDSSKNEPKSVSSSESIRSNGEIESRKSNESLPLSKKSSKSVKSFETKNQFDLQKFDQRIQDQNNP